MKPTEALQAQAYDIFARLLESDAEVCAGELAALRKEQPELHAAVLALIEADRAARSAPFLHGNALAQLPGEDAPARLAADTVIGRYALLRALGSGGMGEVWLARRADRVSDAPVALKLLHAHLLHSALRARFVREGRILGELTHDHVARLLDAGLDDEGQPYLAIEYIDGQRIDQWCDEHRLGIAERLRLFLQVCEAVAHAHAHLIVHRDLKPSNMLVTAAGSVKLLDFGIATILQGDVAEATELTHLGGAVFTPEFAAPEQLGGGAISTATDVYALGVLLYLLLGGVLPFAARDAASARSERGAPGFEPPPPSRAATREWPREGPDASAAERAARRATTTHGLVRALRGDLDTIVMQAMKAAPRERYASVLALAEDIQRHLDGHPVRARADSLPYRGMKFVRRHRLGVATAAMLAGMALAGVVGVAREARWADEQRLRAERVKDFMVSVFTEQDPMRRPEAGLRSPQALVSAAVQRLDKDLRDQPLVHAELLDDLGEISADLGDYGNGVALLERAVGERRAQFGADSLPVAESLRKLARATDMLGHREEAERLGRQALAILQRHGAGESLEAARTKSRLASYIARGKGAPPEALRLIDEAISGFERLEGPDRPDTASAVLTRATLLAQDRRDAEAEPALRDAMARLQRQAGAHSVFRGDALVTLGRLLQRGGRLDEAQTSFEEAAAIYRQQLGGRNRSLVGAQVSLGALFATMGRFDAALLAYDAAAAAMPEGAAEYLSSLLRERGRLYEEMKRSVEAERDLHQAYDLERRALGPKNAFTWYFASQWGTALSALGRLDDAESIQREALRQVGTLLGPDAYQNSFILDDLADTLTHKPGARAEVVELMRRSLKLTESRFQRQHPIWTSRALVLAEALSKRGDAAAGREAAGLLETLMAADRALAAQGAELGHALLLRGRLRLAGGDRPGAHADFTEALQRLQAAQPVDDEAVGQARQLLRPAGSTRLAVNLHASRH